MKKQLSCLLFYFKTIWKREKLLFLNIGISVLINTFASYVNIYFLKYLLDFLEAGKYTYSILWTLGCLMVMTLTANVASLLNIAASNAYFRINTYLRSQVLNISTSVRFEEVENPDVLNNFELAHKCVSQNILSNYTQVIISIVSSVFVIAGTVYISVLGLGQLFLIYLLAINKYAVGGILLANFILYVSASNQIASSISEIVRTVSELHTASVYYEDFNEYMELKETIREKGNDIPFAGSSVPFIEFKNVSFKYPNQESYSLENFSCSIEYGDHISIVGDNGAGKSTFVKLLLRLYEPTAGTICYKGKDIREYDFDSYQAVFAPVFQDYVLNAFSIRENLIFDYDERNDRIKPALEKTGMYDKIVNIGLDRPYSRKFFEDGIELSGGEQQRLVISRAYCKNSEVLILDEPTAAIDPLSERRLFEDIFSNIGEVTSIMISHRMSCSKFSNRIFVMDHGRLVEQGSHGELMGKNGLYASMYNRQAQYYS